MADETEYGKVRLRGKVAVPKLRERSARGNSRYVIAFDCEREREVYELDAWTGRSETVTDMFWLTVSSDAGFDELFKSGAELEVEGHLHVHERRRGEVVIVVDDAFPVEG